MNPDAPGFWPRLIDSPGTPDIYIYLFAVACIQSASGPERSVLQNVYNSTTTTFIQVHTRGGRTLRAGAARPKCAPNKAYAVYSTAAGAQLKHVYDDIDVHNLNAQYIKLYDTI